MLLYSCKFLRADIFKIEQLCSKIWIDVHRSLLKILALNATILLVFITKHFWPWHHKVFSCKLHGLKP